MLNALWEIRYHLVVGFWLVLLGIGAWLRFRVLTPRDEPNSVSIRIRD
ncbi:MAG: hypothetical protein IT331_09255 [Anaerolineae bacterium]|nr:hypothetical protein [Anaerolineae bacterium]